MAKKIDYPDHRKEAPKRPCVICGKLFCSRGSTSHLRMKHYVDIVRYYSHLLSLLGELGNNISEEQKKEIQDLITILEPFVQDKMAIREEILPTNLIQKMTEFGFENLSSVNKKQKVGGVLLNSPTPNAPGNIPEVATNVEVKDLYESRHFINSYIEGIEEELSRYRNNPILIKLDLEGIHIKKQSGLNVKDDLARWKYLTSLLRKEIESRISK